MVLSIKKLVAVTAGLGLVAASVTAALATPKLSDVLDKDNEMVKVSGIVVGEMADDSASAELLASSLAEMASYETIVYGEEVCSVEEVEKTIPGGEYAGEEKTFKGTTWELDGTAANDSVTYTNLGDALGYESSLAYDIGGNSYTASLKETLGFEVTPSFDTSEKRLNAEFGSAANDINYYLYFGGSGLDFNADSDWTSGSTWTDAGSDDDVVITIMGKTYKIHQVVLSTNITDLLLFEADALETYTQGDTIENLKGKDGKDYYAVIEAVTTDSEAIMTLYDAETKEAVSKYTNEAISANGKFAEKVLEGIVQITALRNWGTTEVTNWNIEIAVGEEAITIKHGEGFPYDSTRTSTNDGYDWRTSLTTSGATLTGITLYPTSNYRFKGDDGLNPGEFVEFPGQLAKLEFIGLTTDEFDAKNPEETFEVRVGTDVSDGIGKGLSYYDTSEVFHEVPFFYEFDMSSLTPADDDYIDKTYGFSVDSFNFDGVEYSLKIGYEDANDINVALFEGQYTEGATTATDSVDFDLNVANAVRYDVYNLDALDLPDSESVDIDYFIGLDYSEEKLWLFLAAQTIETKTGNIKPIGTDLNAEGTTFSTDMSTDANFFAPGEGLSTDFSTLVGLDTASSTTIDYNATAATQGPADKFDSDYAPLFHITADIADGDDNVQIVLDTDTGVAVKHGASSNASNSIPGPGYQAYDQYNTSNSLFKILEGASNERLYFYDEFGAKVEIDEGAIVVRVPENRAYAEFKITGVGGEGQATEIVEEEVCAPEELTETVEYDGFDNLTVMTDAEVSAEGSYIVVGGWMVNELFAAEEEVASALTEENTEVMTMFGTTVYVAGWTKEDTWAAAQKFVALLEAALAEDAE
jgi:hypothetical protein